MNELERIKYGEIGNTLRFLHFTHVEKLLYFLRYFIKNSINIELSSRILTFIISNHWGNILNSNKLVQIVSSIKYYLRKNLQREKDVIGFNLAGLKLLKREIQEKNLRGCRVYEKIEKIIKL